MKKKIVISILLIVCVLTLSIISVSKVNAEEEDETNYYYYENAEYYLYDSNLENTLLNLPTTQKVNGIKENYVAIDYTSRTEYTSLQNYNTNLPSYSIDVLVSDVAIDYEYFSMPGFDEGFYICITGFEILYNYYYDGLSHYQYDFMLPISSDDWFAWYDSNDNEIGDLRFFSGFDKYQIRDGFLPSADGNLIGAVSDLPLTINFQLYLVEYNSIPHYQFVFEIYYDFMEDGYQYLTTFYPVSSLTPDVLNPSVYYNNVYETGPVEVYPIYTPMLVFTWENYLRSTNYDDGYDEGYDDGYNDGYGMGQSSLNIDFTEWIATAVGGFLSFSIIPGLSLFAILSFIISLGLLFLVLRFFSGG